MVRCIFHHYRALCYSEYTAISIKVVPKTREKVEYERERLIGKDYSFILKFITIYKYSTKFKIWSCLLMNINRDYVSLEIKFCSVCVFLIITPSKLFALVFDFSALLGDNLNWNSCISTQGKLKSLPGHSWNRLSKSFPNLDSQSYCK